MSDFNFDENAINKLKDMMNKGDLNDVISKIPPEMIQNFSSMMKNNNSYNDNSKSASNIPYEQNYTQDTNTNLKTNPSINSKTNSNTDTDKNTNTNSNNSNNAFDFSNIDMNTILKMKSVMEKMNSKNDPRANLLYSLKPYLRDGRKEKLDQYANLLNIAKIADLLKDNKENNNNG